uniref:Uncharacterized protein n=1 Tax=Kalanchoe fedtschenkoi TaxID=63787 RepID=A0A7N0TKA2_KALFE
MNNHHDGRGVFTANNNSSSSSSSSWSKQSQEEEHEDVMMEEDLRRGPWTDEEDHILSSYIAQHGEGRWNSLARSAGLNRTGKSCRLRWLNYLRPDVRRGNISLEEQLLILDLHSRWGNRWSKIAKYLPGRTDNEIKNYWRTRVQKHAKLLKCDVNSQQFRDAIRYLWMPRLVERIHGAASATDDIHNTTTTCLFHHNNNNNHTAAGFTNPSGMMREDEPYGSYLQHQQVSPFSDLMDDYAPADDINSEYYYNGGAGNDSAVKAVGFDCNNYIDQTGVMMGYGGGDQMHPNNNNNSNSDNGWLMMQSGDVSDSMWSLDDFWFNNSQPPQQDYQQQQFNTNSFS